MKVTVKDITEKFNALLGKTETRESIAEFAQHAMEADDIGALDMEDGADEKIWKSLVYLSGVDLMDEPGIYLHVDDDFLAARRSLGVQHVHGDTRLLFTAVAQGVRTAGMRGLPIRQRLVESFFSLINKLQEEIDAHGARPAVMDDLISRIMERRDEEIIPRLLLLLRNDAEY